MDEGMDDAVALGGYEEMVRGGVRMDSRTNTDRDVMDEVARNG